MTSENKQRFDAYVAAVENRINALFDGKYSSETALRDAMYYSLSAGGKRIRPVLALEFCRICGGEYENRGGKWICRSCGSYKPEAITGEEMTLLYTAYQKLRLADFAALHFACYPCPYRASRS